MGGNLAWTLRTPEGTEYRMDRWTNSMANLIHNPDFLDGTKAGIDQALEEWLLMKSDWENNHKTHAFEHPMTPYYGPYPFGLLPSEYGLVVTDFTTHTILSLQHYTDLSGIIASRLHYGSSAEEMFPDKTQMMEQIARSGRVSSYDFSMNSHQTAEVLAGATGAKVEPCPRSPERFIVRVPGTFSYDLLVGVCDHLRDDVPPNPQENEIKAILKDLQADPEFREKYGKGEEILRIMRKAHKAEHNPFGRVIAWLDLDPFTLETFDDSPDGYEALRRRVLELGFTLTDAENEAWDKHIDRIREMED
jgi:hypothetical protein